MLSNYINKLLNIEDVSIKKITHGDSFVSIFLETKPSPHVCPACGKRTQRIHDYRTQSIKDLPFQLKYCYLILRKRRYRCSCGKKFYESYPFLSSYQHRTRRLTHAILDELRSSVSFQQVAQRLNLSTSTILRVSDTLRYERLPLPKAICIDEFKGDTNGEKYQCILADPLKRKIIDILPDRKQDHLIDYFKSIPKKERYQVDFFICDMWKPYADLGEIYFPNAKLVIDKYHFIRHITWALDRIRKRLQKSMAPSLRKYYKRSRKLIHAPYHSLSDEDKKACDIMLLYNDDLRKAHYLKEWFYRICKEKRYAVLRQEFSDWVGNADTCGIKEFEAVGKTYRNWYRGILNAFKYNLTNGVAEGYNNRIKVIKRTSYGFRDFDRFRKRILHSTR